MFENEPTAALPAHEVFIRDRLDPNLFDLKTFSFGSISFGDTRITPPSGLRQYSTSVDLRPRKNAIVRINAWLATDTGEVVWHFLTIDTSSGYFGADPFGGFLPPNKLSPEGEGSVFFTVKPNHQLPTGTKISNSAEIVFDLNDTITTNDWFNTLDNTMPISRVHPLTPTQNERSFLVRWSGSDEDAGVQDFSIYVSNDGGPFTPWLTNKPSTSATFTGEPGHSYAFKSIARDKVLNMEAEHAQPDAVTRIEVPATAVDITAQVSITRGGFRLNQVMGRYVQEVTLTNTSGAAIAGPVSLVLDGLSSSVTLFGQSGVTAALAPLGSPYLNMDLGGDNVLGAGETLKLVLEFTNPGEAAIQYRARVLAGAGSR